jgi:two-component system, LytTR family, response regulator AlgR
LSATDHSRYVSARTRKGIQIVPIEEIYYFKAEHKYVIAYHKNGELLLDNSLAKLESLYADYFIRIHRNTIIAKNKIEKIDKIGYDKFILKLRDREEVIPISRRRIASLRRYINELTK